MPRNKRTPMEQIKIDRINELARKKKSTGLSDAEAAEQRALRNEYLQAIRSSVRSTLENTVIEYPDGEKIPLADCKKIIDKTEK